MDKNEVKAYLADIDASKEEKNFAMSFYKKSLYIDNLFTEMHVKDEGYGNLNATVALGFKDKKQFESIYSKLEKIIKRMQADLWEFYITFMDKGTDPNMKYTILDLEMSAIKPKVIYIFCDDIDYLQFTSMQNAPMSYRIDASLFDQEDGLSKIWNEMRYIVNIKQISRRTD